MTEQGHSPQRFRRRTASWLPSTRTVLAFAAVPALTLGAAHISGTSAAFTDTAAASSSFTSAAKFLPAVDYVYCETVSDGWWDATREAKLRWPHIGAPFRYQVLVYQDNGVVSHTSNIIDPGSAAAGTVFYYGIDEDQVGQHTGWAYTARVYTVSPSGERSTDWRGERLSQPAILTVKCDGSRSSISAVSDEQTLRMSAPSSTPAGQTSTTGPEQVGKLTTTNTPTDSTVTTTSSATSTATPESTTSEPNRTTRSSTPTPTTVDSTTSTPTPTSTTTTGATAERLPSASGRHTASVVADDTGTSLVVYDSSDEIVYRTAIPAESQITWLPGDDIVVEDSTGKRTVSRVDWIR